MTTSELPVLRGARVTRRRPRAEDVAARLRLGADAEIHRMHGGSLAEQNASNVARAITSGFRTRLRRNPRPHEFRKPIRAARNRLPCPRSAERIDHIHEQKLSTRPSAETFDRWR